MRVRRLGAGDVAAFRALRLAGLEHSPTAFGADLAEEAAQPASWFATLLAENAVFGAFPEVEAPLLGIAAFSAGRHRKRRHIGHIWGVYVRPEARGRGIAAALLQDVIAHARGQVEWLQIAVAADNPVALGLYRRIGFSTYGTEPAALRVGAADLDLHLMARRLPG